ncbi:LytR/AlgR family response regulator transcription factor [Dinghuibacter silviterrae]|nr:LytTR family DNA-binding domain-containing protein [Dinghuibacter silviterrae]
MESGRRETREIGRLLEEQLDNGQPPQKVIDNLQQSIVNTDAQSEFVCMYDTNGIELCHPDPALVGQKIDAGNSLFIRNGSPAPFSDILHLGKAGTGLRSFPVAKHRSSEIVTVYPVKGSDWMVAAHANVTVLQAQLDNLYHQFMVGIILMVLLISGSCFLLIRLIYGKYERQMDQEILRLNKDLAAKKVAESTRKRLVTYQRDEMVSLEVGDIAFIFLSENSVFVQTFLNQRHTVNTSLDELMKQLDNDIFYRANRQCIVNVNAIKTILVYGKNQLQLVMHPQAPEEIIISKNKAAEFKDWLDR